VDADGVKHAAHFRSLLFQRWSHGHGAALYAPVLYSAAQHVCQLLLRMRHATGGAVVGASRKHDGVAVASERWSSPSLSGCLWTCGFPSASLRFLRAAG